jgi:hypothetical protein
MTQQAPFRCAKGQTFQLRAWWFIDSRKIFVLNLN